MRKKNPEHFRLLEEFIDSYILTHDRSPSQREIAAGTGMSAARNSRRARIRDDSDRTTT